MDNDELVDQFAALLTQLHANVDAIEDAAGKARAERLANVAHGALEALQDHCAGLGIVKPADGTNKP